MMESLLRVLIQRSLQMITQNPRLQTVFSELEQMIAFLSAYLFGYRQITLWSLIVLTICLVYVIFPIDFTPDVIPVIGYVDDALVIRFVWKLLHNELIEFKDWREQNPAINVYRRRLTYQHDE